MTPEDMERYERLRLKPNRVMSDEEAEARAKKVFIKLKALAAIALIGVLVAFGFGAFAVVQTFGTPGVIGVTVVCLIFGFVAYRLLV